MAIKEFLNLHYNYHDSSIDGNLIFGYEIVNLEELIYTENFEINHEGRQFLKK